MSTKGPASTSTTSYPSWLSDAGQGLLTAGAQIAQQPYQPYTGPRVADLSPLQQGALGAYGSVGSAFAPLYGTAGSSLQSIISGDMNPYTDAVVNRSTRQVTDAYNQAVGQTSARFNSPGNLSSARHDMRDELNQRALATGLGDAIGSINNSAYNTMRANQLAGIGSLGSSLGAISSALGGAIQAGDIPRQQLQHVYDVGYGDYMDQRNYPWQQIQNLAGLVTGARAGAPSTTTSTQGYDPVSQGVGLWTLGSSLASQGSKGS